MLPFTVVDLAYAGLAVGALVALSLLLLVLARMQQPGTATVSAATALEPACGEHAPAAVPLGAGT